MTRVGRTYVKGTAAGAANDGYFGDGSDGALNVAAGQTFTIDVPSEDTQIIKNYSSVNIAAGATVKTSGRCNGMVWLVSGDFILDGTIDMDKRAPLLNDNEAAATQELHVALCGALTGGNAGAAGVGWSSNSSFKTNGTPGNGFALGGGYGPGSASAQNNGGSCEPRPSIGTSIPYPGGKNVSFCGTGGSYYASNSSIDIKVNGGAGPGGSGAVSSYLSDEYNSAHGNAGDAVGGGAIWIYVMGKVRISATGKISANGGNGGAGAVSNVSKWSNSVRNISGGGGGAGGGIVCLIHSGDIVNNGSVIANGGHGGAAGTYYDSVGNPGQDGSVGAVLIQSLNTLLEL